MENNITPPMVYKTISNVSKMMLEGIKKDQKNQQQGFTFRGIDQVYNALAPALVECGLLVIPKVKNITRTERTTAKGGVLFYVVVECDFHFVAIEDGSCHIVTIFGEAMDSGDKATNKAMAIAYKYACFQTFCIPTEDTTHDPDAQVHNGIQPQQKPIPTQGQYDAMKNAVSHGDAHALDKAKGHYLLSKEQLKELQALFEGAKK